MWYFGEVQKNINQFYYDQAYNWYQRSPGFLREFCEFDNDKTQFIEDLRQGRLFVGENDDVCKGLIYGEPKTSEVIAGHLFCGNDVDEDFVTNLVTYAKNESLKSYKYVVTHVLRRHRFLHKVMYRSGFIDTGMRAWSTVYKNSLLEVVYYSTP